MTENEAIKALTVERNIIESMIDYNHDFEPQNPCERLNERLESINLAIKTLEEIQQYREIGTVEECREAAEKQKPKKPVLSNDNGKLRKSCPTCGCFFSPLSRSCPKCGQAIAENLEGMEDE